MERFWSILIRIAALLLMMLAGYLARKKRILSEESTHTLSLLLMNFIYPASIYSALVQNFTLKEIGAQWQMPLGEFLLFLIGFLVAIPVSRLFGRRTANERRTFLFQCTLMNFIFMPLPLVTALYGDKGAALLNIAYVGGTIAIWTVGIVALKGGITWANLKNIFNMPVFSMIAALLTLMLVEIFPCLHPTPGTLYATASSTLLDTMKGFGAGTTGISMIIAGSGMATLEWKKILAPFYLSLAGCRLILIPLVSLFFLRYLFPVDGMGLAILSLIAAMPVSVSSAAYVQAMNGDNDTAAAGIFLSHLGCLITIPLFAPFIL